MEPPEHSPEEDEPVEPRAVLPPWVPALPEPGAPVAGFGAGAGPGDGASNGSEATTLYEGARFPDLEEVRAAAPSEPGGRPDEDQPTDGARPGLRILGVPAPAEIAGPVLTALALLLAAWGWRRRRRRRR